MAIVPRKAKTGSLRYQVKVKDQYGRWMPCKTFLRKVDAERHERLLMSQTDSGVLAMNLKAGSVLFNDFVETWKDKCRLDIHPGWKLTQDQMLRDYVSPILGSKRVACITAIDISDVLSAMQDKGRANQTMLHVYQLLRKIMEDAVTQFRMIGVNPVLKRYRPKVSLKERPFLNPNESRRLLKHSEAHFLGPAIWLGILAGLRSSEIQALNWQAVDLGSQRIVIKSAYKRKIKRIEDYPKQKHWGDAPISPDLLSLLKGLERRSEFVACGKNGGMLEQKVFHRTLRQLCEECGITIISPHGLRHSTSGIWMEGGANATDIQRLLNQRNPETTSRYIHGISDRLKDISSKVSVNLQPVSRQQPKLQLVKTLGQ